MITRWCICNLIIMLAKEILKILVEGLCKLDDGALSKLLQDINTKLLSVCTTIVSTLLDVTQTKSLYLTNIRLHGCVDVKEWCWLCCVFPLMPLALFSYVSFFVAVN
ncbi:hypothetical protein Hdeb2414_s0023g00623141 [Helianthus debilis subsp. tardiflorus]